MGKANGKYIYILFFIIHNNNKITPISVIFDLPERWKALE